MSTASWRGRGISSGRPARASTALPASFLATYRPDTRFGSDRSISRRERRYRALYQHWLAEGRPIMPAAVSLNLHQILLGPLPRPSATTGP